MCWLSWESLLKFRWKWFNLLELQRSVWTCNLTLFTTWLSSLWHFELFPRGLFSRGRGLSGAGYTKRNIFEIWLNQPKIRLYLPFSGWFGTKRPFVWLQINRKMVNIIWFRIDLIRFRKDCSVCRLTFWIRFSFLSYLERIKDNGWQI